MDSVYQTVVAERFQRLTTLQGAAWINTMTLKIFHIGFFLRSLLKSLLPQGQQ